MRKKKQQKKTAMSLNSYDQMRWIIVLVKAHIRGVKFPQNLLALMV